jgi:site-specific recombinase XerD
MNKVSEYRITRDKFLSSQEARQLLKTCDENSIVDIAKGRKTWVTRHFLVHLALNSGLRVAEIANLQIGDLHLKDISDKYLIVRHGKGPKSIGKKRVIYLDRDIVKHILDYISYKKKVLKQPVASNSPLFARKADIKYSTTGLHLSFKRALEDAKLPLHYSIHSARHTYATILLAKTNNLRFVMRQLGHASLNMTTLYANILPELNNDLANSIID